MKRDEMKTFVVFFFCWRPLQTWVNPELSRGHPRFEPGTNKEQTQNQETKKFRFIEKNGDEVDLVFLFYFQLSECRFQPPSISSSGLQKISNFRLHLFISIQNVPKYGMMTCCPYSYSIGNWNPWARTQITLANGDLSTGFSTASNFLKGTRSAI